MTLRRIPAILLSLLVAGCASMKVHVQDGVYRTADGREQVVIEGHGLTAQLYAPLLFAGQTEDSSYTGGGNMSTDNDGRIYVTASSNSVASVSVAIFEWYYRDGAIVRIHPDTREETRFTVDDKGQRQDDEELPDANDG